MARARLLGTSIRVHERQLPHVFAAVESCSKMLGVSIPAIFVREDLRVPLVAVGLREPYALIISTVWLPQLKEDELMFLIGRELGHIYAWHTPLTSLLAPTGADNPLLGFVLGPWLRRTEYTADRVGVLCCGRYDAAMRAILAVQFQHVAGRVDPQAFAEQRDEIESDPSLRTGELISREPYATHRIHDLRVFATGELFRFWRERFEAFANMASPPLYKERGTWAPLAALLDLAVIALLADYLKSRAVVSVTIEDRDVPAISHWIQLHAPWLSQRLGLHATTVSLSDWFATAACLALAVVVFVVVTCVLRRTPGMFVFGLRWRTPALRSLRSARSKTSSKGATVP
jgi:hypothetical protein